MGRVSLLWVWGWFLFPCSSSDARVALVTATADTDHAASGHGVACGMMLPVPALGGVPWDRLEVGSYASTSFVRAKCDFRNR